MFMIWISKHIKLLTFNYDKGHSRHNQFTRIHKYWIKSQAMLIHKLAAYWKLAAYCETMDFNGWCICFDNTVVNTLYLIKFVAFAKDTIMGSKLWHLVIKRALSAAGLGHEWVITSMENNDM